MTKKWPSRRINSEAKLSNPVLRGKRGFKEDQNSTNH